ncbi:uncharacterized protein LOC132760659 [Ruditapes philippinarum]|uniref:uncharacterized protein LOC132760659 n=1 Tax=Ruditapes philippinarum TaxID=129788 RepID=UPI00295B672F|nr:uncharacterized protein LOC132760659 [Ruditapes philippinarum]
MGENVNGRCRRNSNVSLAYLELKFRDNTIISLNRNRRLIITLRCQTGNLDVLRQYLPCPNLPGVNEYIEEYVGNYRGQLFRVEDPDVFRGCLPCPNLPGINEYDIEEYARGNNRNQIIQAGASGQTQILF